MTNKEKFIEELDNIITRSSEPIFSEAAAAYYETLKSSSEENVLTEMGMKIISVMQKENHSMSAKEIGIVLGCNSRSVSGSMRKLLTDGYCIKEGNNPVSYTITESGKNLVIDFS